MAKIEITIPDGKLSQLAEAITTRLGSIEVPTNNTQRTEIIKKSIVSYLQNVFGDHLIIKKNNEASEAVRKDVDLELQALKIT